MATSISSAGSDIFLAILLLLIFTVTLLLLRHFLPLRTTPAYLLVPVFLALALPASIILLVPVDLASSAVPEDGANRGIWLPERAMLLLWKVSYWLTFVLTWLVLPLLGEYADAGHREPKDRIMYSIRSNAQFYAIVIGCSIAGLLYFFISTGFYITSIKALIMALAYAWGLVLAIYLMGHGLVAIPRQLYRNATPAKRLRNLENRAPRVYEKLEESMEQLEYLEAEVLELEKKKNGAGRDLKEWIEDLADTPDLPPARIARQPNRTRAHGIEVITVGYLADLTRKLKRARHKRIRFDEEWARLVQDAKKTRAIMDASGSRKLSFDEYSSGYPLIGKISVLTPFTRYHLHANMIPGMKLALSAFFATASVCIIWTEIFTPIYHKLSIVGLSIVHHPSSEDGKIGFAGQFMAACWLLYMCAAALNSIREVKVWGNRALVRRHTYSESACWYACQVAKLTVPLSYNFITCLPKDIYKATSFYNFLGKLIDLTPLGLGFSNFFPIFILIPVLATSFNLYGKIKKFAGFGVIEDDADENPAGYGTGSWREGRALIDRELQQSSDDIGLGLSSRDRDPDSSHTGTGASAARAPLLPTLGGYSSSTTNGSSARSHTPVNTTATSGGTGAGAVTPRRQQQPAPSYRDNIQPRSARADGAEDDTARDEENFFSDFAHRVKNTFDTAERPAWIPKVNITRPKWMGGVDGNTESSGRADFGRGLGRWLGGRPEDGHVRL